MKCTIKQLAEELNLSRNTVAKALKTVMKFLRKQSSGF